MKSRSLAALSVSVVFAISGIPAYAGEAEADPFGKYEETLDVHFVRATDDTIETYALGNLPGQTIFGLILIVMSWELMLYMIGL